MTNLCSARARESADSFPTENMSLKSLLVSLILCAVKVGKIPNSLCPQEQTVSIKMQIKWNSLFDSFVPSALGCWHSTPEQVKWWKRILTRKCVAFGLQPRRAHFIIYWMILSASLRFIHPNSNAFTVHAARTESAIFGCYPIEMWRLAYELRMQCGKGMAEMSLKRHSPLFFSGIRCVCVCDACVCVKWEYSLVYLLVNLFRITNRLVNNLFCRSCSADVRLNGIYRL